MLFFVVNVVITSTCLRHHRYVPLFDEKMNGALNMILKEVEESEEEEEDGNSIGARAATRRRMKSELSKEN